MSKDSVYIVTYGTKAIGYSEATGKCYITTFVDGIVKIGDLKTALKKIVEDTGIPLNYLVVWEKVEAERIF